MPSPVAAPLGRKLPRAARQCGYCCGLSKPRARPAGNPDKCHRPFAVAAGPHLPVYRSSSLGLRSGLAARQLLSRAPRPTARGVLRGAVVVKAKGGRDDWSDGYEDDEYGRSGEGRSQYERGRRGSGQRFLDDDEPLRQGSYDYPPPPPNGSNRNGSWSDGYGPEAPTKKDRFTQFLVLGGFLVGIGAGVGFDSALNFDDKNIFSRQAIDEQVPNKYECLKEGRSAMVFDSRVFVSFNPFNVYVGQPEVKPGCVLRQENWRVLESRNLISQRQGYLCKSTNNTFGWVGDLNNSPEVSCVYHSEDAENMFLKDPSRALLGDGFAGPDAKKAANQGAERAPTPYPQ